MSLNQELSEELYRCLRERRTVAPLMARHPQLTIDDAYAISLGLLERRLGDGERVIGKKIGATSKPVQDMLGIDQPDFGLLTDWMQVGEEVDLEAKALIQPRAEAEIAFVLKHSLNGPGVTAADVIAATDYIAPCFEIVDSRIQDWKIGIVDTIADNASCGVFVLGEARVDPRGRHYFWLGGAGVSHDQAAGTDTAAFDQGLATLTALSLDLGRDDAPAEAALARLVG